MLVEEAAKLKTKTWACVAPNYEYGQSCVKWFKELLTKAKPDVSFVAEQFPALGKIDAGATVQALEAAKPEGIFNATFAGDLINFVRQGNTRGLFEGREVASMLTGEPEYLDPLGAEAPKGWIVTGYPHAEIKTPEHTAFYDAYKAKFNDYPRLGSVVGFDTMNSIAAALTKAGDTDNEKLIAAMRGLKFGSAFGAVEYRAIDHQSTLGAYVGPARRQGRQGRHGGLGLSRRRQVSALRRRGEDAASGERLRSDGATSSFSLGRRCREGRMRRLRHGVAYRSAKCSPALATCAHVAVA